jgi:hypothetical protein
MDVEMQVWIQNKSQKKFWVYNNKKKSLDELDILPNNISSYYLIKYAKCVKKYGKENIETIVNNQDRLEIKNILKKYLKEIMKNREELLHYKDMKFDILQGNNGSIRNLNLLPKKFFEYLLVKRVYKNINGVSRYIEESYKYTEKLEDITFDEYNCFEECYNGGLLYLKEPGIYNCYGYDYKNCYGSVLGNRNNYLELNNIKYNFMISEKCGEMRTITTLNKHLQYGLYKVKIISTNEIFNKFFHFNKNNTYTHYDIQLARDCMNKLNGIEIKLLNIENNACVYESKKLIKTYHIFGKWFDKITELKSEMENKTLIKFLSSSLWGFLSKKNLKIISEEEMFNDIDYEYKIIDIFDKNGNNHYKILPLNKKIYNTNFRLKPFITSFVRVKMFKTIMDNNLFMNVIRVHTDGIVLNNKYDFSIYDNEIIEEDKTTGNIEFKGINDYTNDYIIEDENII